MPLTHYHKKRNFEKTPEPKGQWSESTHSIFVVQLHDASRLHYDFRISIQGVLKSWAVPKGPSLNPKDKRLAVPTEDHPLEYANFEGVIPEGNYGAGSVLLWDKGTFKNVTEKNGQSIDLETAYKHGHILINLKGKKLNGVFALQRFKGKDNKDVWLLIKKEDEFSSKDRDITKIMNKSIKCGLTLAQFNKEYL